jgi:hypothetical protein
LFWMYYVFFKVVLRRRGFNWQRFGTLCLFHLHRRLWRWNRQSVPKRWQLNSIRRRTTQNKT